MVVIVEGGRDEGRKVMVLGSDEKGIKKRWPHIGEEGRRSGAGRRDGHTFL